MRVVVTGGRGLLGGAVVRELLARGHQVTTFQRTPSGVAGADEILGDISDRAAVRSATEGQEAVVHMAAKVSMTGRWADFLRINVEGTTTVLDAARSTGVSRVVHVSSPSVAHAGEPLVGVPAGAADPLAARGDYARSKAMAEVEALAADGPDLTVTALRPHLVWGPGDTQLIGRIVERARSGRLVLIDDGAALIDTTYVDNAAEAIAQALVRCSEPDVRGRAFVVTNGQPRTVAEIFGRIARAAGVPAPTRHVPFRVARAAGALVERAWARSERTEEPPITSFLAEQLATAHWFDQRETQAALQWRPRVGLEEGFARLAESYGR